MVVPSSVRQEAVIHERVTKGGRRLFYRLEVIQQPERARACGSGPKSSADRRPVDPPPVVELRIFEGGPTLEQSKDVTFLYNANFFLFATLEHARVMAHGRVQTPAANTPPVLTGMPVSGMAYLDRPQEAGYFLFPDLSVRHEGRYRLTFNLYEQTKEDKDMDKEPSEQKMVNPNGESFDWRMEVKSNEFIVFSAKKFPGLTESTALSRTVAEQGCRVRIRRDVRMRRRDGKASGGGDYDNAEDEYSRRHRTQTPEAQREFRARSMSNESVQRTPYSNEAQRRSSGVEYPPPPPSFGGPPAPTNHLAFGSQNSSHYPPQPYARDHHGQSSVPPSPSYAPGPAPQPTSYAPPPPPPPPPAALYQERPSSQHYGPPHASPPKQDLYAHEYRRPSGGNYGPPLAPHMGPESDASKPEPPRSFPPLNGPSEAKSSLTLPPLSAIADRNLVARAPASALSPTRDRLPPFGPLFAPGPGSSMSLKRSYEEFSPYGAEASRAQPVKNHSRQTGDDLPHEMTSNIMKYKRASGAEETRYHMG